ncbi:hypothetical protein PR048_027879 [Dryococelus australis]|uniref:Uncharacterized protein n=1 Tax=Dryococelus australis TaxID=614101 RepID=A0ABQ9GHR1_9NEOP|nr:hypothetical protein PR048_027879 [Dryococelus australis]
MRQTGNTIGCMRSVNVRHLSSKYCDDVCLIADSEPWTTSETTLKFRPISPSNKQRNVHLNQFAMKTVVRKMSDAPMRFGEVKHDVTCSRTRRGNRDLSGSDHPIDKTNQVESPAGSPAFRTWESCRTIPLVVGFSRVSSVSPALYFGTAPYSLQSPSSALKAIALIGSQDLAAKSRPNLFIHFRRNARAGETGYPREKKPTDQRHRSARLPLAKIREWPGRGLNPVHLGGRRRRNIVDVILAGLQRKVVSNQNLKQCRSILVEKPSRNTEIAYGWKEHLKSNPDPVIPIKPPYDRVKQCREPQGSELIHIVLAVLPVADLPWRSRLVRHRSVMQEALDSSPGNKPVARRIRNGERIGHGRGTDKESTMSQERGMYRPRIKNWRTIGHEFEDSSQHSHGHMKVKRVENGAAPEWKGRGNLRTPRKPANQRHRPARFPHAKIQERPGRELNPRGEQANRSATLTASLTAKNLGNATSAKK